MVSRCTRRSCVGVNGLGGMEGGRPILLTDLTRTRTSVRFGGLCDTLGHTRHCYTSLSKGWMWSKVISRLLKLRSIVAVLLRCMSVEPGAGSTSSHESCKRYRWCGCSHRWMNNWQACERAGYIVYCESPQSILLFVLSFYGCFRSLVHRTLIFTVIKYIFLGSGFNKRKDEKEEQSFPCIYHPR